MAHLPPPTAARPRAGRLLLIAVALLIVALLLLGAFTPAVGARYPLVIRIIAQVLIGVGWPALVVGLHRVIAGPRGGPLARPRRWIANAIAVGSIAFGLLVAWAIHAHVSEPYHPSHHHDWD